MPPSASPPSAPDVSVGTVPDETRPLMVREGRLDGDAVAAVEALADTGIGTSVSRDDAAGWAGVLDRTSLEPESDPTVRATTSSMSFGSGAGWLALALSVAACGGGGDGDPGTAGGDAGLGADAGPPAGRVELGTGRTTFVPIPESGAALELVAGPQGGWHVDVTARLYEFEIAGLLLTYEIVRDGEIISMPRQFVLREAIVVREGDHWLRVGDFVPFDIEMPSEVVGDTVTVRVVAQPAEGGPDDDERVVRIVDEE